MAWGQKLVLVDEENRCTQSALGLFRGTEGGREAFKRGSRRHSHCMRTSVPASTLGLWGNRTAPFSLVIALEFWREFERFTRMCGATCVVFGSKEVEVGLSVGAVVKNRMVPATSQAEKSGVSVDQEHHHKNRLLFFLF